MSGPAAVAGNLYTSDDGDYALVRYAPGGEDGQAGLSVTTWSGIRALAFSRSAD